MLIYFVSGTGGISSTSFPTLQLIPFLFRHYHKNTVQAADWSPNGDMVATASRDQTVRVFDIRAMKEFQVFKGHKKEVCCKFVITTQNLLRFSQLMSNK